jgi:hypothetical protein
MRGESLGMALEVLRRDMNCDVYDIGFADENAAQMMFAAMLSDDGHTCYYDTLRKQLDDKSWIFILMNDGIGGDEHGGSHWSLIVMDRIHKLVHYYDSYKILEPRQRVIAESISSGLLAILGENACWWCFCMEWNSPHQFIHNQFNRDHGPCGPFVWKMSELLVSHIKRHRDADDESGCSLALDEYFPARFMSFFDSLRVRRQMGRSIARWKAVTAAPIWMEVHDTAALHSQSVTLSGPAPPSIMPSSHHGARVSNSNTTADEDSNRSGSLRHTTHGRHDSSSSASTGSTLSNPPSNKSASTDEVKLDDNDTEMHESVDWAPQQVTRRQQHDQNERDLPRYPPQRRLPHQRHRSNDANDANDDWAELVTDQHARSRELTPSSSSQGSRKRSRQNSDNWSTEGECGRD